MNFIVNSTFFSHYGPRGQIYATLDGWEVTPDTWHTQIKSGITAVQCDQDSHEVQGGGTVITGWPLHVLGTLSQIVTVPEHTQITLGFTEVQHHGLNLALIMVEGLVGGEWVPVWERPSLLPDVPVNTSLTRDTWYTNTYTFMPSVTYSQYRLAFHGQIDYGIPPNNNCGWKITNVVFEVA
jgi:hypothetical protein